MARAGRFCACLLSVFAWNFASVGAGGTSLANIVDAVLPEMPGTLDMSCANVAEDEKIELDPQSSATLQAACQLEVTATPPSPGDYHFLLGISIFTDLIIDREDALGTVDGGFPKVFALHNVTESFTSEAGRALTISDTSLASLWSSVGGICGNVFLLAALDSGQEFVAGARLKAVIQCPDETGMDLLPTVSMNNASTLQTQRVDNMTRVVISSGTTSIPITVGVSNTGSVGLAARTSPDFLKVWIYLGRTSVLTVSDSDEPTRVLPSWDNEKMHLPQVVDRMLSTVNIFDTPHHGSPAIAAAGSAATSVTNLELPDDFCGDALVIVNVDPLGELKEGNTSNNVIGLHIYRDCSAMTNMVSRCDLFRCGTRPGRAVVALGHEILDAPPSMVEYDALSGGIRHMDGYTLTSAERVDVMRSVIMSHAVEAEVDRLQAIGSCPSVDIGSAVPQWNESIVGRLGESLASIQKSLSNITFESDWERQQVELMALAVKTAGQLLMQPGSLRTILSTLLHHGERPGGGGGGDGDGWGGGQWPGGGSGWGSSSWSWSPTSSGSSGNSWGGSPWPGGSGSSSGYWSSGDHSSAFSTSADYSSAFSSSADYSSEDSSYSGYSSSYSNDDSSYSDSSYDESSSSSYDFSMSSSSYSFTGDFPSSGDSMTSSMQPEQFPDVGVDTGSPGIAPLITRKKRSIDLEASMLEAGEPWKAVATELGKIIPWDTVDELFRPVVPTAGPMPDGDQWFTGRPKPLPTMPPWPNTRPWNTGTLGPKPSFPMFPTRPQWPGGTNGGFSQAPMPGMGGGMPWMNGGMPGMGGGMPGIGGGVPGMGGGMPGMGGGMPGIGGGVPGMGGGMPGMGGGMTGMGGGRPGMSGGMTGGMGSGMSGGMPGMGGGMDTYMRLLGPVSRLQMFFTSAGSHIITGQFRSVQLPGCFPEEMTNNFRRFLRAIIWDENVQQIPGYEDVDGEFVSNLKTLTAKISAMVNSNEEVEWFDDDSYPRSFERAMEDWAEGLNIDPMRPLPADLVDSALNAVVQAASDITFESWEDDRELKNRSVCLLSKVATALRDNNREEVLDKFEAAVRDLHREMMTEGPPEGMPGEGPDPRDICRRIVELSLKKKGTDMGPLLVQRDGDIYSMDRSPLTNQFLWKKVVSCSCSSQPEPVPYNK